MPKPSCTQTFYVHASGQLEASSPQSALPNFFTGLRLVIRQFQKLPEQVTQEAKDKDDCKNGHENNAFHTGEEMRHG